MTTKKVTLLIASVFALALPTKAATRDDRDDSFDFAVMDTPSWTLVATTQVKWNRPPDRSHPTVAKVQCRGESQQFDFD